jgi:hypothetical protein
VTIQQGVAHRASRRRAIWLSAALVAGLGAGLGVGFWNPLVAAALGASVVAGPTYLGMFLLVLVAALILVGLPSLVVLRSSALTAPLVLLGTSLAVGMVAGNIVAASTGSTFAAPYWRADADVSLRFEGQSGYAESLVRWTSCVAPGPSVQVAKISGEVGSLGGRRLTLFLYFTDEGGSVPAAKVEFRAVGYGETGTDRVTWTGPGQVLAHERTGGRIAFVNLGASSSAGSWPDTLSGEITWSCVGRWSGPW